MNDLFIPDSENNPEEEAELTYRLQQAVHEYESGSSGKCIAETAKFCYTHKVVDYCKPCGAESYSVLHYQDYSHDHGGRDCMCFEEMGPY